jgi:DeoR/GlpR family transcriptional regulator of sugar metabolism
MISLRGTASYEELSEQFNVSIMTVRRDVDELARQNKVLKVLGGVQSAHAPEAYYETQIVDRLRQNRPVKRTIAEKALEHIQSGDNIFLDGSTTCFELAKLLGENGQGATIVTNSILVCQEAGKNKNLKIMTTGGQYDPDSFCFAGDWSEDLLDHYFVDKAFMSTRGLIPDEGTYESNVGLFRLKQKVAKHSKEVILLVDASKLGQRALSKVLDISDINRIIIDRDAADSDLDVIRRGGCAVDVVEVNYAYE